MPGVNIGENTCLIRDAAPFAGTQTCGSTFIVAGLCGIRPVSVGLASLPCEAASETVYMRPFSPKARQAGPKPDRGALCGRNPALVPDATTLLVLRGRSQENTFLRAVLAGAFG